MGAKNWTKEEVGLLEDKWGSTPIPQIAKQLGRTIHSIKCKAYKIGLDTFIDCGEYVTFNKFTKAIGYGGSYGYLEKRLLKLDFPLKHKKSIKMRYKVVYIKDFWIWAEQHKQDISFAKFEKGMLGEEPDWVQEKRKADSSNPSKLNHNRKWTKAEDNLLIEKTKLCRYTYKDLARDFNRTENAIKRRLHDLAVPYRPVPLDTHVKWTDEENKKMFELHEKGYDTYAIAQALNKTHLSISDRLKKVVV
ncbi:hypothetical protein [Candidatus Clostridium helianthi]|uniref:Uncharacterized protein n=1 Tax=Candidatus Clostridium helianthi TaxID=3381660 RepID=A0ABW8SC93_9CLOT